MTTLQECVSQKVNEFMAKNRMAQEDLADELGIFQSGLSVRLANKRAWKIDELEKLSAMGVEIPINGDR